jgi:hypothetical protein
MRYFLSLILIIACLSARSQPADIKFEDYIYNENIATVLLYPGINETENPRRLIGPPILPLQSANPLVLEFDDLTASFSGYRVKIFHCNADWTKSVLNEIEYTFEYNEYPVIQYEQSFSTKVPYFHYRFNVPRLKLSGNYVLVVYSDHDRKAVLSRRFMIYDPKVSIAAEARFSQGISQQFSDQQIDFKIDYKGYPLNAPQTDLKVVIRKNFRWDQIRTGFKPTNVRPFDYLLEYTFFDLENTFPGGNEFRYFDSRTLLSRGFGIEELERTGDYTKLTLFPDKSRSDNGYLQLEDLNGQFIVDQRESGRGSVEADYSPVVFTLRTQEDPSATYYVNGAFNLWQLNDRNKMTYNPVLNAYEAEIFLKQGVINYDYTRVVGKEKPDEAYIEGNYGVTENDYDILVYYRPQAGRSDLLIGYRTVEWNRRR